MVSKRFLSILMVMLMLTGMEQGAEAYDLKAQEIREVTLFREFGDLDNLNGNAHLFWGFQPGSLPEFSGDERYPGDFTDMVLDVGLNPDLTVGPNFSFMGFYGEVDEIYHAELRVQLGRQDMFSPEASDPRLLINDAPPDAQHIVGSVAGIFTAENHNPFDLYVFDLAPWAERLKQEKAHFTINTNHPTDAAPFAVDWMELSVRGGVYLDNGGATPAPEPATILLFGIGLVGLAACVRKGQGG